MFDIVLNNVFYVSLTLFYIGFPNRAIPIFRTHRCSHSETLPKLDEEEGFRIAFYCFRQLSSSRKVFLFIDQHITWQPLQENFQRQTSDQYQSSHKKDRNS